ncbi:hypothetical protein Dimus_018880 [Dionaea muscipula]
MALRVCPEYGLISATSVRGVQVWLQVFSMEFKVVVGNGKLTSFRWDLWAGSRALKTAFLRLYSISHCKFTKIDDCVQLDRIEVVWNVSYGITLRSRNLGWHVDMLNLLKNVEVKVNCSDKWEWQLEKDRRFSVKSLYSSQVDNSESEVHRILTRK